MEYGDKMPAMLHGSDDAVIAENVKMLKNHGFDEAEAIKLAQQYAQDMSDITKARKAMPGKPPQAMPDAPPSSQPITDSDQDEDAGGDTDQDKD